MPEFIQENNYQVEATGTTPFTLNMGKETIRLFNLKLNRCKTHKVVFQELLDRYETSSWSKTITSPHAGLKTLYQVDALCSDVENEEYLTKTIRIMERDYLRFRTLANFLRISMSKLFAFLLAFDELNWFPFYIPNAKSYFPNLQSEISTKVQYYLDIEDGEILVTSPQYRGS
jgi:hypothetical protein